MSIKDRTIFKYIEFTLAANGVQSWPIFANFIYLIENSISTSLEISFDDQSFSPIPEGLSIQIDDHFEKITFRNPTGSPATIKFAYSNGVIQNNNTQISGSIDANNTPTLMNSGNDTATAGGVTIAADATRKEIIIHNTGSVTIWAGSSGVSVGVSGTPIPAGTTFVFSTASALTLKAASNCTFAYNLLTKP